MCLFDFRADCLCLLMPALSGYGTLRCMENCLEGWGTDRTQKILSEEVSCFVLPFIRSILCTLPGSALGSLLSGSIFAK